MTNSDVKREWRKRWTERYQSYPAATAWCESCGDAPAAYVGDSGSWYCDGCADAAIEHGRTHVPESYED